MSLRRGQKWHLAVLTAIVAVLIAGCGGGNGSSSTSSSEPSSSSDSSAPVASKQAEPPKSPIKIAVVSSLTGAADGEANKGTPEVAKAWEEWVNDEEGGINGHPIEVLVRDSKDDGATGLRIAKELIGDESVLAEVGGYDVVAEPVVVPAFNEAKMPVIGGQKVTPEVQEKNEYMFPLAAPATTGIELAADAGASMNAPHFALATCSHAAACSGAAELIQPRLKELGMTYSGSVGLTDGEPNYTAACLSLQEHGAEQLWLAVDLPTGIRTLEDCEQQGVDFTDYVASYSTFDGSVLGPVSKGSKPIVGAIAGFPWWETKVPAIENFVEVMEKYAPETNIENNTKTALWAALEMFRKAMANAGENPTRAEVAEAMWHVKNEDLGGLLPEPVTFQKGKAGSPVNCMWRTTLSEAEYSETKAICLEEKGGA